MQSNLAQEKSNLANIERKARELQTKFETLSLIDQDLQKSIQLISYIHEHKSKINEVASKLEDVNESINRQNIVLTDYDSKVKHMSIQLSNCNDRLSKLEVTQTDKRKAVQEKLSALKIEYQELASERLSIASKIEGADAQTKELEIKVELFKIF